MNIQKSAMLTSAGSGWYKVCTQIDRCTQCTENFRVNPKLLGNNINQTTQIAINIYPNPASDVIHLDAPINTQWQLYSLAGETLATGIGNLIQTHTLSPGCYSIKVQEATPMRICIVR